MFKLLTGSLMLALSAFSFFSHAVFDENLPEYVAPKIEVGELVYDCTGGGLNQKLQLDGCLALLSAYWDSRTGGEWSYGNYAFELSSAPNYNFRMDETRTYLGTETVRRKTGGSAKNPIDGEVKSCPPDSFPSYTIGPRAISDENPTEVCFPKFPQCPLGYHKYSVEPYGCVPIECPGKGSAVNNITTHGKLPFGQSGTFCDGTCSYSVSAGSSSYDGAKWASGVSNGAVCGNGKFKDEANFTPEEDEGDCTTHALSNGMSYQDCSNVSVPDEGEAPVDTGTDETDNKADETAVDTPFEGQDCGTVNDKEVCVGNNIVDAIQDQNNKLKKDAAERHNKLVDQQKEISDYVESKNKERELARADDAKQVINGLNAVKDAIVLGGTGGGGGGSTDEGVVSAIDGLGQSVGETGVETDSEPSAGIESFYEPEYPNGFKDVWDKNKAAFDASAPVAYIKQWEVSVAGNAPDMDICFDLGSMANFGCKSFEIDPRVFPFLRIIILISTAFLCRALVMGG